MHFKNAMRIERDIERNRRTYIYIYIQKRDTVRRDEKAEIDRGIYENKFQIYEHTLVAEKSRGFMYCTSTGGMLDTSNIIMPPGSCTHRQDK
tara:strand:+ start:740 stop:1015 length:276 start_codon:yes stop_codon:yes gene_type:complete